MNPLQKMHNAEKTSACSLIQVSKLHDRYQLNVVLKNTSKAVGKISIVFCIGSVLPFLHKKLKLNLTENGTRHKNTSSSKVCNFV